VHVDFDPNATSWRTSWASWMLHLQLRDDDLHVCYLGPQGRAATAIGRDGVPEHLAHPLLDSYAGLGVRTRKGGRARWLLVRWTTPEPDVLLVELHAQGHDLSAVSEWRIDEDNGVLTHAVTLTNDSRQEPVTLCSANSVSLVLPAVDGLTCLGGQWIRETQVSRLSGRAPLLLESRSGKTGFECAPYLAVHGRAYTAAITLAWSGDWFLRTVPMLDSAVHVSAGLNPWHLAHELSPGARLALPEVTVAIMDGDLNGATQALHRHRRRRLAPRRQHAVPVQFNSWYPYQTRPEIAAMTELAGEAARLGCEVFVQDAGWYTNEGSDPVEGWLQRTGDWLTDLERFPGGMAQLSAVAREHGMRFGLWFEPEAVSRSSGVYRRNPGWTHNTRSAGPGRAILDLGNAGARAWAARRLLEVLTEADATWMKWDMNLNLVLDDADGSGPDPVVAHTLGVYALQEELLRARPQLLLEMCAGGGGRFDDRILEGGRTNWMSDQTQPLPNLSIHFGSHLAHLPEECNDWIVDWPPHDSNAGLRSVDDRGRLALRAHVAMLGSLGVSAPVWQWSEAERRECAGYISWYKSRIRPLFAGSDQYLLTEQPALDGQGDWAAIWYVADDATSGHLTAVRLSDGTPSRFLPLHGLDQDASYEVSTPGGVVGHYRGQELGDGFAVHLDEAWSSGAFAVRRVDQSPPWETSGVATGSSLHG